MNSTWLITPKLANQRAPKALFTCVVFTNDDYNNHHHYYHIDADDDDNNNNNIDCNFYTSKSTLHY